MLHRFKKPRGKLATENRSPNPGDLLQQAGGGNHMPRFKLSANEAAYSQGELGDNTLRSLPVYEDKLSGFRFFFANLPIQCL